MKKTQLTQIIKEELKKMVLNENYCQCYAGTTAMTCHTGPPNYNNYWVQHGKCCGNQLGGTNFTPHPSCHDEHCNNLIPKGCFDDMTAGPTVGGGTGLEPSHTIDGEEKPSKDLGILKDKKLDTDYQLELQPVDDITNIKINKAKDINVDKLRLKESELVNLIKGVINEQNYGPRWICEVTPGNTCHCIMVVQGGILPNSHTTKEQCEKDNSNCCGKRRKPTHARTKHIGEDKEITSLDPRVLTPLGPGEIKPFSTVDGIVNEEDPDREYPTITHDEFMDGIKKYCNKNTSGCPRRCKSDKEVMNLINKWCKSV